MLQEIKSEKDFMEHVSNLRKLKRNRSELRNAATVQEVLLWSRIRSKQLGVKFRRQHSFNGYIVDFYCSEKKLAIEIDGWKHNEVDVLEYDKIRSQFLHKLSIKVLRFWNNEINNNLEGVILKIEESLWETSPQSPPLKRRGS